MGAGPGGSWNYFDGDVPMSNHVAPAAALVKSGKFQQASGCIDMVGLSDACSHTQAGTKVESPVFPFEIMFKVPAERVCAEHMCAEHVCAEHVLYVR